MNDQAKEARREYQRRYREQNREKVNEYQRQWNAANRDKVRIYKDRYWTKKAMMMES